MGYFGKQIYNEPMSMYVDPKLDILANSLQAVQKRHDENYAQMSALDLMAHNTAVLEGDKGIKDAALGRLKAQRDAIAASGDYAYAMPKIGAAVRDWGGDENLIAAKENRTRVDKAEELRQQMRAAGHIDLDFNPSDKFSTIDPTTGQRRLYTSKLEKQLDYDARAQEVSKLIADTRNLGLTPANIRDYLQSGSISGISDAKVRANLEGAISRFMESPEGNQMKRKLTQIDGMDADQADNHIANFLYGVSKAQVHEKVDINYQVNQPAVQRENREDQQAHDREQSELAFRRSLALQKAKDEADLIKAKAVEEAKAVKAAKVDPLAVAPSTLLLSGARKSNADKSFGTNTVTENAAGTLFPSATIKDPVTNSSYTGMRVPMETATIATKYNPESGNFTKNEIGISKDFYIREDRLKQAKEELANIDRKPTLPSGRATLSSATSGGIDSEVTKAKRAELNEEIQRLERGYGDRELELIRNTSKARGKSPAEIENAVNTYKEKYKHRGIKTEGGRERTVAEKYKTAFQNDGAKHYENIGKKLAGTTVDATFSNREPQNTYRVDGVLHGNFVTKMSGAELKAKLTSDELDWAREHDLIVGGKGGINDGDYYDMNFVSKIPESASVWEAYDNKVMGTTDAAKNHANYLAQTATEGDNARNMRYKMQNLEANANISDDPSKPKFIREEVKRKLLENIEKDVKAETALIKEKIKDETQKQLLLEDLAERKQEALKQVYKVDKFNDMDVMEKEAYINYLQANKI